MQLDQCIFTVLHIIAKSHLCNHAWNFDRKLTVACNGAALQLLRIDCPSFETWTISKYNLHIITDLISKIIICSLCDVGGFVKINWPWKKIQLSSLIINYLSHYLTINYILMQLFISISNFFLVESKHFFFIVWKHL